MSVISLVLMFALCGEDVSKHTDEPPKRLSIEAMTDKVADVIRAEKPRARIDKSFAVVDLTTDAVWDQLHVQVVKVKRGAIEQSETFVLGGDKVQRIGRAFGGDGVTTIVVADPAGDKKPLLIYAFAWGSGDHRSEIGILDLHSKMPKEVPLTPVNYSQDDYTLRRADSGDVEVLIKGTSIGHITASRKGDALDAAITLVEKVPDEIRKGLR